MTSPQLGAAPRRRNRRGKSHRVASRVLHQTPDEASPRPEPVFFRLADENLLEACRSPSVTRYGPACASTGRISRILRYLCDLLFKHETNIIHLPFAKANEPSSEPILLPRLLFNVHEVKLVEEIEMPILPGAHKL